MKFPNPYAKINTGSRLYTAYTRIIELPAILKNQKLTGKTLSPLFSDTIHCTINLAVNIDCPTKPRIIHISKGLRPNAFTNDWIVLLSENIFSLTEAQTLKF